MDAHESEIEQDRQLMRRSRESIAETDRHVAESVLRLVESQKRLRAHVGDMNVGRWHLAPR